MNQSQTWCIDGLGRLREASETITDVSNEVIYHSYTFNYDKRSELTYANLDGYELKMIYDKAGNMTQYYTDYNGGWHQLIYEYSSGDLTEVDGAGRYILWNENGNVYAIGYDTNFVYNWDNKLRHAEAQYNTIDLKYDPMGNRVQRASSTQGTRKYIVDIAGGLPTILLEVNSVDGSIMKSYIYANAEVLAQHDGNTSAARYFYLHDRLGSVREVIDTNGSVVNHYTYDPFGQLTAESAETVSNPFKFTGQWFDSEIGQYYLRARQYDPILMRFTGRDPIIGRANEPITLHKYLYCINDPVNLTDPSGRDFSLTDVMVTMSCYATFGAVLNGSAAFVDEVFMSMAEGRNVDYDKVIESAKNGALMGAATGVIGIGSGWVAPIASKSEFLSRLGFSLVTGEVAGAAKAALKEGGKLMHSINFVVLQNEAEQVGILLITASFDEE